MVSTPKRTPKEIASYLRPLARRHRVKIQAVKRIPTMHCAPFAPLRLGLDRHHRTILYVNTQDNYATGLIHELGHALFDGHGKTQCEYEWLGWEWIVAQRLGVEDQWVSENRNYVVSVNPQSELRLLSERVTVAKEKGYLSEAYLPRPRK